MPLVKRGILKAAPRGWTHRPIIETGAVHG